MGHFGDEPFQAIDCKCNETKHYLHPEHKRQTERTCPS